MTLRVILLCVLCLGVSLPAHAQKMSGEGGGLEQADGTQAPQGGVGGAARVHLNTLLACEDQTNSVCRIESQWEYEDVAASQTDQIFGTTGAVGDLLAAVFCVFSADPSTAVSVKDGAGSGFTIIPDPGAAGFYNSGPLNWISADGGWKITTGTNTTCRVSGRAT